jgi:hypothetical protein
VAAYKSIEALLLLPGKAGSGAGAGFGAGAAGASGIGMGISTNAIPTVGGGGGILGNFEAVAASSGKSFGAGFTRLQAALARVRQLGKSPDKFLRIAW